MLLLSQSLVKATQRRVNETKREEISVSWVNSQKCLPHLLRVYSLRFHCVERAPLTLLWQEMADILCGGEISGVAGKA